MGESTLANINGRRAFVQLQKNDAKTVGVSLGPIVRSELTGPEGAKFCILQRSWHRNQNSEPPELLSVQEQIVVL